LHQAFVLRQSEKLATLGKLSAGMAHELNNPASAAQRGAVHLGLAFKQLQQIYLEMGALDLSKDQLATLLSLDRLAQQRVKEPIEFDALARSDRELALETWLEDQGVENAWDVAPALVGLDCDEDELKSLAADFNPAQFQIVIAWLRNIYTIYSLMEEIEQGAGRISEIVKALKEYTYLDQAPRQSVNLHEGLNNTLVILRSKLDQHINVHRQYDPDLPNIEAYGSELNQVWTNMIDNAIDAVDGGGDITLRTCYDDEWVYVEIEDNGIGIPEDIQPNLFDPFFTTKEPGKGTGMGLNISHNIVVKKHQGGIEVRSEPGNTCFSVRLPRNLKLNQD
jgi:signal transduction histidine kinase